MSIPSTATVLKTIEKLRDGPPMNTLNLAAVEAAAKRNGVRSEDLGELFTCLFAEVLYEAVTTDSEDLMELADVVEFAKDVGLSDAEIGDGFSLAALKLEALLRKDARGFYSTDYPTEVLLQTAKLFFLADKMIGSLDGFYGKRFAVALAFFTTESLRSTVTGASSKLFRTCVNAVLADPTKFSAEEVDRLREFLSSSPSVSELRPAGMQNIIMESLQNALDRSLNADSATPLSAKIANFETIKSSKEALGWNSREFAATLETRTLPVFEKAAREIIQQAMDEPDRVEELSAQLQERIDSLGVDIRKARVALMTIISEKNNDYMYKIEKVYNASGGAVDPVFKIMTSYANSHTALKSLSDRVMDGIEIPVPGLPFAEMVRASMYRLQLLKHNSAISNDMFALNEAQQQIVKKNMALPKITSWISQCILENSMNADAKAAYRKQLRENGVTDDEWRSTSVDFYYQEVQRIAQTRAVPSEVDMIRLGDLRDFLDCPQEAVNKVNLELLGDKYAKAVTEAMTPSGVITEEYLDGLERLRNRLALTKADAENLLSLVTRNRLQPLIKDLADQWRSDTDANAREKLRREKSGDPISSPDNVLGFMETGAQKLGGGPNVFMREALNLVDFVQENYIAQDVDIKSLDKMPVNAVGLLPETDLVGLFKHYLLTALVEQDDELRRRYVANEKTFALLLGIDDEGQMRVKESLAYSAYKNMLKSVMRVKDAVGAEELKQFAVLKNSLGLDQATADRIYDECARGAIIETAASIMRSPEGTVTADTARRLRSQVQSLGLELQKDTGFNERFVAYLFSLEVQYAIENDMVDELQEIQQAYDIPEERAEAIIEVSCVRYMSQILNFALRAAKKYDETEAVKWGQAVLKYAPFISNTVDADGNMFSESDKDRLISFLHDELRGSGNESEDDRAAISRLKDLIKLTKDYVAPLKGIEGLEGKIPKSVDFDEGQKKWSWG